MAANIAYLAFNCQLTSAVGLGFCGALPVARVIPAAEIFLDSDASPVHRDASKDGLVKRGGRNMILLKTSKQTIGKVIELAKHAVNNCPNISPGDLILISQTEDSLSAGEMPVQYCMEFVRCYDDTEDESTKLWGKHWPVIIEGRNCRPLRKPFRMSEIQVSGKNYGQGFTVFNVNAVDETYLRKNGFLETVTD